QPVGVPIPVPGQDLRLPFWLRRARPQVAYTHHIASQTYAQGPHVLHTISPRHHLEQPAVRESQNPVLQSAPVAQIRLSSMNHATQRPRYVVPRQSLAGHVLLSVKQHVSRPADFRVPESVGSPPPPRLFWLLQPYHVHP